MPEGSRGGKKGVLKAGKEVGREIVCHQGGERKDCTRGGREGGMEGSVSPREGRGSRCYWRGSERASKEKKEGGEIGCKGS